MRERYADLIAHPEEVQALLVRGAEKARALATPFIGELRHAVGLRSLSAGPAAPAGPAASKSALPAFKQYREADGRFYFKLTDAQGRVLLQSDGFDSPREVGEWVKRLQTEGLPALTLVANRLVATPEVRESDLHDALTQLVVHHTR